MNRYKYTSFLIFFILVLRLCTSCERAGQAKSYSKPIKENELLGAWTGFSEDGVYYYLNLTTNGLGFLGYVYFFDKNAHLERITNWLSDGRFIKAKTDPLDPDGDQIRVFDGETFKTELHLHLSGNSWKRKVVLRPEEDRQKRKDLVTTRIKEYLEK